jgi:hyperosmotically inducible periplasmic protein
MTGKQEVEPVRHDILPDEKRARRRGTLWGVFGGAIAGAAAMFILDPQNGRRRRSLVRDKAIRLRNVIDRTVTDELPKRVNYMSGFVEGAKHRAQETLEGTDKRPENEHVLVDRVLSSVFRDPDLPKGQVNVDAAGTTVYLRGSLDDDSLVQEIEHRVRAVEGVDDVVNLINHPDADPSEIHGT